MQVLPMPDDRWHTSKPLIATLFALRARPNLLEQPVIDARSM